METMKTLLAGPAARAPRAIALEAPGRDPLTFGTLLEHVTGVATTLGELGLGPGDRVALALANGPEAATAFLAVAAHAAVAPLNPAYQEAEFDFYLGDLQAKALIVAEGAGTAALAPARARGVPVLWLRPGGAAGEFTLEPEYRVRNLAGAARTAGPGDIALLLHTSGTTARPKLVPLTQANLLASAGAVAATLALGDTDSCLGVMPLFHIHGLVAGLLAPLSRGGRVVCSPGFHPIDFFGWLRDFSPTWYTAVPSMHQAILARAAGQRDAIGGSRLRFIRSSSAALAPQTLLALEDTFRAPVVEAYGMTEAAHQMACNPLPPGRRVPGSVGLAAGPRIAIRGIDGSLVAAGEKGEVVIQGPGVTPGYVENPAANEASFVAGWFRTGDEGFLDPDGYLFLTGRLKEIINRGGEKIAPREVEEVLLGHPAVGEAAVFAVPDPSLGEEVGAAVVLRAGASADVTSLKSFAAERLSFFKTPRHMRIVDAIPKGPTGKVQRVQLASQLGMKGRAAGDDLDRTPARDEIEAQVVQIWKDVLEIPDAGIEASFLDLGGDSILALEVVSRASALFGVELTLTDVLDTPTVTSLARRLARPERSRPPAVAPPRSQGMAPLSRGQQWWLALEDASPPSAASNRASSVRIEGPLRREELEEAFWRVVERHEPLRTSLEGSPGARIQRLIDLPREPLPFSDLGASPEPEREATVARLAQESCDGRFALEAPPLWRACLVRMSDLDHRLILVVHHALFDGWSKAVLISELAAEYHAVVTGVTRAPPASGYLDRSLRDHAADQGPARRELEEWWAARLEGRSGTAPLPFARPRPATPTFRHGHIERLYPAPRLADLQQTARHHQVTLYMLCLAAFHEQLAGYTGQPVVTGCPVAGRDPDGSRDQIGIFVNILPLWSEPRSGAPLAERAVQLRREVLEAMTHRDLPLDRILAAAGRPVTAPLSGVPLVGALFGLRSLPPMTARAGEVRFSEYRHTSGMGRFDLTFDLAVTDRGLEMSLDYARDLHDEDHAARILDDFQCVLER